MASCIAAFTYTPGEHDVTIRGHFVKIKTPARQAAAIFVVQCNRSSDWASPATSLR